MRYGSNYYKKRHYSDHSRVLLHTAYNKSMAIWLFSRGEESENSDVDILVSFDKDAKVSLFQYAHIICQLEELLQRKVDLVEEGTLLPFAQQTANHDKILIYERGNLY